MYQFVIFVLYFTIAGLFAVCWFTLSKWSSRLHTYLFFSCVSNLVYDTGCLLELHARDQGTYVAALKMAYLGRIWIGLSLVMFILELCHIYVPPIYKMVAALIHVIIFGTILTLESNDLYYNYMEFVMDGDFPKLIHTGGPLYYVQTALNLVYTVTGIYLITRTYIREKNAIVKQRYLMMVIAMFFVGSTYVVYFFKLVPLARKFDVMTIGLAVCTIFMLIAIIKYKMLDATTVAKNYVIDELSEGIILVDAEDRVQFFNKPAQKLFPELGDGEDSGATAGLIDDLRYAIESGEPVKIEDKIYTPRVNRLTEDGTVVGTLYSLADDSEHYRYTDELRRQSAIAANANRAKSQFLANMSHEIRTPINAVLGLNEIISRECGKLRSDAQFENSGIKESIDNISVCSGNIQSAGSNLLSIINDILDLSKIEAGKMDITEAPYTLSSLLNDVSNMITFKAQEKELEFIAEVNEMLPDELIGDKVRVRQVITNILTNAVKYTDKGCVRLTVRGRAEGGFKAGGMLNLEVKVRDTGIGIRHEDLDKLFDTFQRLELDRNSTVEGTGLGLAISKYLVALMDGDITVDSKYGEGSEFTITIPQKIVSTEPVGDFKVRVKKDVTSKKPYKVSFKAPDVQILIVDDTRVNLTVAKALLKDTQMQIDVATGGSDAIDMAARKAYDLILMDQRMPGMDGTEALEKIRSQDGGMNLKTPVICMTADAIIGAKERYIAEGFDDYLPKPVDSRELEQTLMKYLPQDKVTRS